MQKREFESGIQGAEERKDRKEKGSKAGELLPVS
jgi:hypothetical protein